MTAEQDRAIGPWIDPAVSLGGALLYVALTVVTLSILTRAVRSRIAAPPPGRPWLPEVAFLALAIFLLCTVTVPPLLVKVFGSGNGADPSPAVGVAATALANVLGIALTLVLARRRYHATAADLALDRPAARVVAFGVAAILLAFPAFLGVSFLNLRLTEALGMQPNQALVQTLLDDRAFLTRPWVLASIVFVVPFCEEVLFRGLLQRALRVAMPAAASIAATAFLFAVVHDPQSLVPVFTIGVVLGVIVERTGSVWASTAAHAVFNAINLWLIARQ